VARQFSTLVCIGLFALLGGCGGGGGGGSGSSSGSGSAPDTTPNGFSFTQQADTGLSAVVISNEITIAGITAAAAVSITGGEYSIDGGAFTASAGTVTNNQRIRIRVSSSAQFSSPVSATLTVGGVSGAFTATTQAMDATPAAFEIQKAANATRGGWVTSPAVTITGINTPVPITIANGEYSIGGGAFTTAAGTISNGQSIVVRALAASGWSAVTRATVTVGGVSGEFEIVSELPAYLPDAVAFDGQDVVYLLSTTNRMVFRWSLSEARYLGALSVGLAALNPTEMTYSSANQRLYLGYPSGAIQYITLTGTNQAEVALTTLASSIENLQSAGNYLLAHDGSSYYGSSHILSATGAEVGQLGYYSRSSEYAWDPNTSRLYHFRDGISPNDLNFAVIDQSTGQITSGGETPYHGSYSIQPPIRVSQNGRYVLLGSGDLYEQNANTQLDLRWAGSLGSQVTDARWFANGSIVALTTAAEQTTLRRLNDAKLVVLEQLTFTGRALRVLGTDTRMAVLVANGTNVQIHTYVPSDDSDGDGASNTSDAFPLDRAASVDTDQDGYPDAWNAGRTQADSTTGLAIDAFPSDAACWLAAHGSGGVCNYAATMPNYTPDALQVVQGGDVIYLLSPANRRVYRWSIAGGAYLNPFVVGINEGFSTLAPTKIAYSEAHQRVYLGYENGAIRYIATAAGSSSAEVPFANTAMAVAGLGSAGNYLLAQDGSGAWATHYVFSASGAITDQAEWNHISAHSAWDPNTSRYYYFSMWSPADLNYEQIDQSTGQIVAQGESPYHGNYNIVGPIRPSQTGQYVLLGSGDMYAQPNLSWSGSIGGAVADARWFANGTVATAATSGNQTTLRRLASNNLTVLEQRTFAGTALRLVGSDTRMTLVVTNNGTVQFHTYEPSDDSDGDGALNTVDAFPLDRAASVDTDRDGYPDAWNAGRSAADSTTGLALDAFPNQAACWLPSHGSGGVCNFSATIPSYLPDRVAQNGDLIYLLSTANRRVYRRSISTGQYLDPYVVGIAQGFTTVAPTSMAFAPLNNRLYLGYPNGAVRYFDVSSGAPVEVPFATAAEGVNGLVSVGNFLFVGEGSYYGASRVLDSAGAIVGQNAAYPSSSDYAWDPVHSRLYYFRDGTSPNDLQFSVINQATGQVGTGGETPYHGSYNIRPPIRVSFDGRYILLGSGDIYERNADPQLDLRWVGSLGYEFVDARWMNDGSLVTIMNSGAQTTLRRLAANTRIVLEQLSFAGEALRVVGTDSAMTVLYASGGTVNFRAYVPNNDSDGDGVVNTQDAFPLDIAASLDTDRDGYPDGWNAGHSQGSSTTGLVLDEYPMDSGCWLVAHGSGGVCNPGATVPAYTPEQVVSQGDVIYLLSGANRRVYRWSMATGQYLNPYVVGIDNGSIVVPPTRMTYSSAHQRLYFGYDSGAIRYIDVNAATAVETPFTNTAMGVGGLTAAGNYVVAQDGSGAWATHYVISASGVITDQAEWNHVSSEATWDPVHSRLYYYSMWSPRDLNWEQIDQTTGQIVQQGETPYHGDFTLIGSIRVSADGRYVLVGAGDLYRAPALTHAGNIGNGVVDAVWRDNLLVELDTYDAVRIRDARTHAVLTDRQYLGQPLKLAFGTSEAYLVHIANGNNTVSFLRLPFNDADGDTLPVWWETLYSLNDANAGDAAADGDGDGVDNAAEFANHTDPTVDDTDGDGLDDGQEIVTWTTDPTLADTDGDGLGDHAEVITYNSDPRDTDSDDDTYPDLIETLQGGNPTNAGVLPMALTNYTQTFEVSPNLAWSMPEESTAPWTLSTTSAHAGARSYRSGATTNSRFSGTRLRGFFASGTLSFWARSDAQGCCNQLYLFVDGVQQLGTGASTTWTQYDVPLTLGLHDIEWRFTKHYYGSQGPESAWIDDVVFTSP
jgi:hypothetical protein